MPEPPTPPIFRQCQATGRFDRGLQVLQADSGEDATGRIWPPEHLHEWIGNPKNVAPSNMMAFAGVKDPAKMDDVIASQETLKQLPRDRCHETPGRWDIAGPASPRAPTGRAKPGWPGKKTPTGVMPVGVKGRKREKRSRRDQAIRERLHKHFRH